MSKKTVKQVEPVAETPAAEVAAEPVAAPEVTPTAEKRGPGRPKGSKNSGTSRKAAPVIPVLEYVDGNLKSGNLVLVAGQWHNGDHTVEEVAQALAAAQETLTALQAQADAFKAIPATIDPVELVRIGATPETVFAAFSYAHK